MHDPAFAAPPPATAPREQLHRFLPRFATTPTVDAASLATAWDVARVMVKDESARLGLGSFKVLGASWAVYRMLLRATGLPESTPLPDFDRHSVPDVRLVTATDGNHGRAVAHVARLFGLAADIFVPADTIAARIEAIRGEGARVTVVDGDYDDACAAAAAALSGDGWLVSDTTWPGHADGARWVVDGYSTMLTEIDEVLAPAAVDLVVVPVGVGSLAAAVVRHYCSRTGPRPRVVGVEPVDAACVGRSLAAGRVVQTPGPHGTVIAGLNCGIPSGVAWPLLAPTLSATVAIDSTDAESAMRRLLDVGVRAGATGAAATAGAEALLTDPSARAALGIGSDARALVLMTEGPTDPDHFAAVAGGTPW